MQKIIAALLSAVLLFSLTACGNSGISQQQLDQSTPAPTASGGSSGKPAYSNEIIVGSTTQLNSDFAEGWTNGTSNKNVKDLIFGYKTVAYTEEGRFIIDPTVVEKHESTDNPDGTKTHVMTIRQGLTYNDGTAITAKDYVFYLLNGSSPQFAAIEADNTLGINFVGYEEFSSGETRTFSGVRLLDEMTFSVTIKAEELPYFYDLTYASALPYPMHVLAPGVEITDDGQGATLSEAYTEELVRKAFLDQSTGYRYAPRVTAGPYRFESYDAGSNTCIVTRNDLFAGDYEGIRPSIERIIVKQTTTATQMDELASGAIHLSDQVSGGTAINSGLDLAESGAFAYISYPRAGYGKIAFACDFGPTQFPEVRQALAWLLDRDEFARQYTGGFGSVVDGYYGVSQWEYTENKDQLDQTLTHYSFNPEKAKEVLIEGGWVLNEKGQPFTEGTDTLRYKEVDGELMPLIIRWANTPDNPVSDLLNATLPAETMKIGMQIVSTTIDFNTLLNHLYKDGIDEPVYHMFNMGTGFDEVSAAWYYYSTDPRFFGLYNTNFIADEELEALALDMKATDPADTAGWSEKWVKFQQRWNYLLPDIPLYCDEYHQFYSEKLENFRPSSLWSFGRALPRAQIQGYGS